MNAGSHDKSSLGVVTNHPGELRKTKDDLPIDEEDLIPQMSTLGMAL